MKISFKPSSLLTRQFSWALALSSFNVRWQLENLLRFLSHTGLQPPWSNTGTNRVNGPNHGNDGTSATPSNVVPPPPCPAAKLRTKVSSGSWVIDSLFNTKEGHSWEDSFLGCERNLSDLFIIQSKTGFRFPKRPSIWINKMFRKFVASQSTTSLMYASVCFFNTNNALSNTAYVAHSIAHALQLFSGERIVHSMCPRGTRPLKKEKKKKEEQRGRGPNTGRGLR